VEQFDRDYIQLHAPFKPYLFGGTDSLIRIASNASCSRKISGTFQNRKTGIFRKIFIRSGKSAEIKFRTARGCDSPRVRTVDAKPDAGALQI
jgi:hypothetical protein